MKYVKYSRAVMLLRNKKRNQIQTCDNENLFREIAFDRNVREEENRVKVNVKVVVNFFQKQLV